MKRAACGLAVLVLNGCGDMSGAHEGALMIQAPSCMMFCFAFVLRGDWTDARMMTKETQNLLEDEVRRRLEERRRLNEKRSTTP